MSDEFIEDIDDILSDVLNDVDSASSAEIEQNITFGQSVSAEQQTTIVDNRINHLATDLDIPPATVELAKSLRDQYRDRRGDLIGTALEMIAASCLYCAVKVTEVPLDPTDFVAADDTVVTRKSLLRRSKDIASTVGLDPSAFFGSEQYVDRYCDALGVSNVVNERAREIIEITEESGLSSGKSPSGWAAAAVYNACLDAGETRTQRSVSKVANVSEVTIRNRYQEQRAELREVDQLPSNPIGVINHIADASGVATSTQELAELLIQKARSEQYTVDADATLWGLAALHRASQLTNGDVKLRALSQHTDEDSDAIKSRALDLRSVINQVELAEFRATRTE
ncbi:transcription initiation factor IIB family protein [Halalkalirubrum salinum]|uniref:transcription initiation factor IIB family protein n=1 Tax=Halalkalirubrum salinum TaxID=2563889 RepID=UPI0010FB0477|nr:transcription initiation factor IIB family protein [Halalkalirubrum salinum]